MELVEYVGKGNDEREANTQENVRTIVNRFGILNEIFNIWVAYMNKTVKLYK